MYRQNNENMRNEVSGGLKTNDTATTSVVNESWLMNHGEGKDTVSERVSCLVNRRHCEIKSK